jgi:long-chain fatty acid transport protein
MKRCISAVLAACVCVVGILLPVNSYATNGYFLIGYGQKSRSMGGVGVAHPQGLMAAAANPAAIADVGMGLEFGMELFNPPRSAGGGEADPSFPTEFQFGTDGAVDSGANEFLIPSFGAVYQFNRKISMGMTAIGNGANTRYREDQNFFSLTGIPPGQTSWGTLGVNLLQMQMLFPVSYKINRQHTVGVAPVFAVQSFRAYGLGNFGGIFNFSSDIDHLTNQGNAFSYGGGVRFGWLGKFFDKRLNLGANYSSRVYMTEFDEYRGLFAEQGDFDIPPNYAVGFSFKVTPKLSIAADVQWIMFSEIASVGNRHTTTSLNDLCSRPIGVDPSQCTTPARDPNQGCIGPEPAGNALGEDNGWGFGWGDATAYKIGLEYEYNDQWTFRAGYNYGESVIPDDQLLFNMLAPALVEDHYTVGLSYRPAKKLEFSGSFMYAAQNSQTCEVNDGCRTLVTQREGNFVAAEMEIFSLGASFAYYF